MPNGADLSAGASHRAPAKRKITERRRAQNREAQRLYRERKRKSLFDNIAKSTEPGFWTNASQDAVENAAQPAESQSESASAPMISISQKNPEPDGRPAETSEVELNEAAYQVYKMDMEYAKERNRKGGLVSLQWLLNSVGGQTSTENVKENISTGHDSNDSILPPIQNLVLSETVARSLPVGLSGSVSTNNMLLSPEDAVFRHPIPTADPQNRVLTEPESLITPDAVTMNTLYRCYTAESEQKQWNQSWYTLFDVLKAGTDAITARQSRFIANSLGSFEELSTESYFHDPIDYSKQNYLRELLIKPPSPLKTFIGLNECAMLTACIVNAEAIGMWNPMPADFKDPFKSPFVQAYYTSNQNLQVARQKHSSVTKYLRATNAQYQLPHRAYIDIFPFPQFRENIILATKGGPEWSGFEEDEFCLDLGRNALVCWGSGDGSHGGQPWTPQSWEAKPWFLRKWWMLLDDDLKESSRWWREHRGDVEELD